MAIVQQGAYYFQHKNITDGKSVLDQLMYCPQTESMISTFHYAYKVSIKWLIQSWYRKTKRENADLILNSSVPFLEYVSLKPTRHYDWWSLVNIISQGLFSIYSSTMSHTMTYEDVTYVMCSLSVWDLA